MTHGSHIRDRSILRRFALLAALAVTALALMGPAQNAPVHAAPLKDDFTDLAQRYLPAVVNITATRSGGGSGGSGNPFGTSQQSQQPRRAQGSGFIIDASGVIVTNNHVIAGAAEGGSLTVTLSDGTELPATIRGRDQATDIAVLQVQAGRPLPFVGFGNSDSAEIGSWVLAIGNPFGFGGTVTHGIVSARNRNIRQGSVYDDFIQTDAAINSGNSGGPLFDMNGEVIGINTAIISPNGLNIGLAFAIPSYVAQAIVSQILRFGEARRGWLGVRITMVTPEIANQIGLNNTRGAVVTSVTAGSPAATAGIQVNDVILRYNNRPIRGLYDLPRLVTTTDAGATVPIRIWRGGQVSSINVTIEPLPGNQSQRLSIVRPEPERFAALGVTLSEMSIPMRIEQGIHRSVEGLMVVDVDPGSPAAARLKPGDVITSVYGWPVDSMAAMKSRISAADDSDMGALLLKIDRKSDTLFEALPVDE